MVIAACASAVVYYER